MQIKYLAFKMQMNQIFIKISLYKIMHNIEKHINMLKLDNKLFEGRSD